MIMTSLELKSVSFSLPSEASTSNDITSVFQNTTRCPICLLKYKNPRRLHCDHSFCKSCLQGELDGQKQKGGNLSCVVCQEPVVLPMGGVEQLDGMLIIYDITEFYQRSPLPKIQCSKCNGGYCSSCINLVCHRCDKYISTEFCTDCFEGFCSRCAEEHEKTTGDHILVDIDQAHDIVKENSEDGEEEGEKDGEKEMVADRQMPVLIEEDDEMEQEEIKKDGGESSHDSESELDFVYDIEGKSDEQTPNSVNIDPPPITDSDDENGGELQLLSHTTMKTEEEQNEEADIDTSINSSQGGEFDYVYEVNVSNDNSDDNDDDVINDDDSPTSSQSGVAMSFEINERESQGESQEEDNTEGEQDQGGDDTSEEYIERQDEPIVQNVIVEEHPPRDPPTQDCPLPKEPSVVHNYEDLEEIVNATVNVNISPEEVNRLRPSAPQNDRRRRIARIRPDMTHEPKLPEKSYYEIQSLKWCSRITIGFVLVLTLCTLTLAGLAITAYLLSSQNTSTHIFQDYNVIIDKPYPFWTRSMNIVTSGAYDSMYYYQTNIYLLQCNDLIENKVNYTITKSGTQIANVRNVIVGVPTAPNDQFIYLAPNSIITFSVLVQSDYTYTGCTSELNIYNNYDDYLRDEGLRAIYTTCIDIKRSLQDSPTVFTYTVREPNFYFVTLSVQSDDSYSVNITIDGTDYDTAITSDEDYITKCTITSSADTLDDQCDFQLIFSDIVWNIDSYCVVADTKPLTSSDQTSFVKFSVSYSPNIFRNFAYIVIILPLGLYFVLCLLVWLCFKGFNIIYVKCRNMHFKHEYRVTEI